MIKPLFAIAILFTSHQIMAQSCQVQGAGSPEDAALRMEADFHAALITSREALRENHRVAVNHLNRSMPRKDIEHFLSSLTFNENGLTGYRFDILRDNGLSYSDAYSILGLFGAQSTAGAIPGLRIDSELDHHIGSCDGNGWHGYYCQTRGTCAASASKICTYNC